MRLKHHKKIHKTIGIPVFKTKINSNTQRVDRHAIAVICDSCEKYMDCIPYWEIRKSGQWYNLCTKCYNKL